MGLHISIELLIFGLDEWGLKIAHLTIWWVLTHSIGLQKKHYLNKRNRLFRMDEFDKHINFFRYIICKVKTLHDDNCHKANG